MITRWRCCTRVRRSGVRLGRHGAPNGPAFLATLLEWVLGAYSEAFERDLVRSTLFGGRARCGDGSAALESQTPGASQKTAIDPIVSWTGRALAPTVGFASPVPEPDCPTNGTPRRQAGPARGSPPPSRETQPPGLSRPPFRASDSARPNPLSGRTLLHPRDPAAAAAEGSSVRSSDSRLSSLPTSTARRPNAGLRRRLRVANSRRARERDGGRDFEPFPDSRGAHQRSVWWSVPAREDEAPRLGGESDGGVALAAVRREARPVARTLQRLVHRS